MKEITSDKLNIGEGHPLDIIKVANPTKEDEFATAVAKYLLRYVATKFARELADREFGRKADAEKKPIIYYLPKRLEFLNLVLIEVTEPYMQTSTDQQDLPPEQVIQKGESALDIGRRNILNELGIPDKPPVSSNKDVAANIVNTEKPPEKVSPMAIKKEKDKLTTRAKTLGIKISKQWSLEKIKKTILEG